MEPAASRVLNTYELVEMILSYLPMRDVANMQAVCKKWQSIIEQSKDIQQTLFLVSSGEIIQPKRRGPIKSTTLRREPIKTVMLTLVEYDQEVVFNYLLQPNILFHSLDIVYRFELCCGDGKMWVANARAVSGLKSMYLTQPPCTTAGIAVVEKHAHMPQITRATLRDQCGLRIGKIVEAAGKMVASIRTFKASDEFLVYLSVRMPVSESTRTLWDAENAERKREDWERYL